MYFCRVPPKRVIIRQGHFAENLYFILSGQGITTHPIVIFHKIWHGRYLKFYLDTVVSVLFTAVVLILDKNPKTGETQLRTATIMRKGTSFGVRTSCLELN